MIWLFKNRLLVLLPLVLGMSLNASRSMKPNATKEIRIGILLAQTISDDKTVSAWKSGDFYASAFQIAVEEINRNPSFLPGHYLTFVYNDTKCLERRAMELFHYQVFQRNVVGVIGLGCSKCECLAKYAGDGANIMMVSHVSSALRLLILGQS